jgi:catechol 2,3-dioxygenase-like lactoylglutathione lyase family enzyme
MRILILLALLVPSAAREPPKAHFHHIHLNTTDPAAAIDFYTRKFDFDGSRILFTQVKAAPPSDIVSAIWHFGWGAEDMPATYRP